MNITEGEIITLDNNLSYIVMQRVIVNENEYFLLMSTKKPVDIIIVKLESEAITTVNDNAIITEILKKLI